MSSRAPHHARALSSLPAPERQGAPAVILAGGRGTRMSPFTSVLPKPLMPIDERSVLEIVIEQLAKCGFRDIVISIGYLGHLIEAILGDGSTRDVSIEYAREEEALGTAGPLRKVPRLDGTFVAMNGDVLTNVDHADLVHHHRRAGNTMTIATHQRIARIDYGVLSVGEGQAAVRGDEIVAVAPGLRCGNKVADPTVAVAHHGNSIAAHILRGDLEATSRPGECRDDLLNHLLQICWC